MRVIECRTWYADAKTALALRCTASWGRAGQCSPRRPQVAPDCLQAASEWLGGDRVVLLTPDGQSARTVLLVRPDAHLAWRGNTSDGLRRWLAGALDSEQGTLPSQPPCSAAGKHDATPDEPTRAAEAASGEGLCARKKAQTRHKIQTHALRLFLAKGYDATTVEEIAAAAGVLHMPFFRHTKESVVDTDDYDPMIARLITSRPSTEDPLTAIHQALLDGFAAVVPEGRDMLLTRTRLVLTTPALRARLWENQHATVQLFTDALTARRDATELPELEVRVLAAAALATLTTALIMWVDDDGAEDLAELVDQAFAALRRGLSEGVDL